MKLLIYIILISCVISCKPSKSVKKLENISSLTAKKHILTGLSQNIEEHSIEALINKSGYWVFPMDPSLESFFKIEDDSSITSKNLVLNAYNNNEKSTINAVRNQESGVSSNLNYNQNSDLIRHSEVTEKSSKSNFKRILNSIIVLLILVISLVLIKKII